MEIPKQCRVVHWTPKQDGSGMFFYNVMSFHVPFSKVFACRVKAIDFRVEAIACTIGGHRL